jgi:uncharacterized protein
MLGFGVGVRSAALALCVILPLGCTDDDSTNDVVHPDKPDDTIRRLSFSPVEIATTDEARRRVITPEYALLDGRRVPLGGFKLLARSGDPIGDHVFGGLVDQHRKPLRGDDGSQLVSPYLDFSSLLPIGKRLFSVTHFETRPGVMYVSELAQDPTSGELSMLSTAPIDFSAVSGVWTSCAGSVTPWNTHLGSEEYPPDARATELKGLSAHELEMLPYFGLTADSPAEEIRAVYNPYRYGYAVEVTVDEAGRPSVAKRYAMGRRALELGRVMPDERTVYLTDDGFNDGFYLFVADEAGDLSAGTLYAMRFQQTSPDKAPRATADATWIDLGHATDAEIEAGLDAGVSFSNLFDVAELLPEPENVCPPEYRSVNTETGRECLLLKTGETEQESTRIRTLASRLEARRYAAYMGATTEFRKEEGMAFDPDSFTLFVSFSHQTEGMVLGHADWDAGGPDHVRLQENDCGAVYAFDLGPDPLIGSDYVAQGVRAIVEGIPVAPSGPYAADGIYATYTCSVNAVANPDNLAFIRGHDTLIIGEDSDGGHRNDMVWAFDLATGKLTRIESTPYGSETTSLYFYQNINGFSYLKSVIQHPYWEGPDTDVSGDPDGLGARRAYDGYIGPLPALE